MYKAERNYPMKLSFFFKGIIEGSGYDDIGAFTIHGRYGSQASSIHLVKSYIIQNKVFYTGKWQGTKISDMWTLPGSTGWFELTPDFDM
jgi:hypothetical protein